MLSRVRFIFNEFNETYKTLSRRKNDNKIVCQSEEKAIDGDRLKDQYCINVKICNPTKSVDAICIDNKKTMKLIEFKCLSTKTISKRNCISNLYKELILKYEWSNKIIEEVLSTEKWFEIKTKKYYLVIKISDDLPAKKISESSKMQKFKREFNKYIKSKPNIIFFSVHTFEAEIDSFKMHPEVLDN